MEEALDDEGAHHQHHQGGGEGEQPGVLAQEGKGRAGVLDVGQIQNAGDEGDGAAQGDAGADGQLGELVAEDEEDGEDGVTVIHGISLSVLWIRTTGLFRSEIAGMCCPDRDHSGSHYNQIPLKKRFCHPASIL